MENLILSYTNNLIEVLKNLPTEKIINLAQSLLYAWENSKYIYICGNGGSAGNAIHIANDFIYGAGIKNGKGMRIEAISSNPAVITCLANDIGYENIFSEQLIAKGAPEDVLIALSGSGNSLNIIKAIEAGNKIGMKTFAIIGFSGGRCKEIVQHPIHIEIDDMQISEDLQLIIAHICMQWLSTKVLVQK